MFPHGFMSGWSLELMSGECCKLKILKLRLCPLESTTLHAMILVYGSYQFILPSFAISVRYQAVLHFLSKAVVWLLPGLPRDHCTFLAGKGERPHCQHG